MGWSPVQAKFGHQGSGLTFSLTFDSNVVVGNRINVAVYVYGSGITLDHVSDNLGNQGASSGKYDQVLGQADPFNGHVYVLTVPITTGGACTVTATASGSASFMTMKLLERSGLSTATGSAAWDVTASNNGTLVGAGMASGTTGAVGAAGELAMAAFGDTDLGGSFPITSPGGWTEVENDSSSPGGNIPMVVDEQTPSNGATVSATWTTVSDDAGNGWAAGVVVFKLAGGTGPQDLNPSPAGMTLATATMSW